MASDKPTSTSASVVYPKRSYRYSYLSGPDKVRDWSDAERCGLNCGALVHLLYRELFGINLPVRLMCLEIFHDRRYFVPVEPSWPWQLGDIAFFGRAEIGDELADYRPMFTEEGLFVDWRNHPRLHLAFFTGEWLEGEPVFIHATGYHKQKEGRQNDILLWPLSSFTSTKTYQVLHGIRRYAHNPPF